MKKTNQNDVKVIVKIHDADEALKLSVSETVKLTNQSQYSSIVLNVFEYFIKNDTAMFFDEALYDVIAQKYSVSPAAVDEVTKILSPFVCDNSNVEDTLVIEIFPEHRKYAYLSAGTAMSAAEYLRSVYGNDTDEKEEDKAKLLSAISTGIEML